MQQELLIAFIVVFTLDSIIPGPAVTIVMSRASSSNLLRTLPLIAGLVLGDLFLFILALAGLAALAAALGPLFVIIKWCGICYLLYLAYTLWNASAQIVAEPRSAGEGWRSFAMGLVLPLGNPKAVGFYAALLPTVMDVSALTIFTAVEFAMVIIFVWGAVLTVYASIANQGRRYLGNTSMLKWLNRSSAGAMVGVAGVIAMRD